MKLTAADFPKLQISLVAAVLMICAGAAAVVAARSAADRAQQSLTQARMAQSGFTTKLRQANQEEHEVREKAAILAQLQARGIFSAEERLEWAELISSIRDKRRLIDLQYEFAPQRMLDSAPIGGYRFNVSTMQLDLKLLHEEDLLRFIGDLRSQARALVLVRNCTMTRLARGAADAAIHAQLHARCQIDWVTISETTAKQGG